MATKKYTYYMCYGIVKGRMPKNAWEFKAPGYDEAIRHVKRSAKSNYSTDRKTATLFYEDGHVMGWCFRPDSEIIYVDKWLLQDLGLMPRRK